MKFSKKSRYGLRALVDLSVNSKTAHVSLNSIAERNDISLQYLEQVFAALRRAGIVKSIKGSQGGYLLSTEPQNITVAEILEALEGSYQVDDEEVPSDSASHEISATIQRLVIDQVNRKLDGILGSITLADLEKDYIEHRNFSGDMYYI